MYYILIVDDYLSVQRELKLLLENAGYRADAAGDFTSIPEYVQKVQPDFEQLFTLAQQFLESEPAPGEQQLFYIWGHSYEYYVKDNWDRLEKLCRMFEGREDIFRGTNRECLEMFGAI